jgi:predicted transcriptional regulator
MTRPDRLLTVAELEIMNVLWSAGGTDVHEVLAGLAERRAYTTVSTLLRILEQKGFVTSHKEGRRHVYAPTTAKPDYEASTLHDLVGRLFGGDPSSLVRRLLSTADMTDRDLAEIRRLLDEREER